MVHGKGAAAIPNPIYYQSLKRNGVVDESFVELAHWTGDQWQIATRSDDSLRSLPLLAAIDLCHRIDGLHAFESFYLFGEVDPQTISRQHFHHPLLNAYWQGWDLGGQFLAELEKD
jgi:hypothetical protein